MFSERWQQSLYLLIRIGLALAFLSAGIIKIMHPLVFAVTVDAFGILPGELVLPTAYVLPMVEIIGALMLLFDIRGGLGLITLMLVLFILVLGYGRYMGLDIDCGCYGPGDPEAEAYAGIRSALIRDTIMLAGVAILYTSRKAFGLRPVSIRERLASSNHQHFKEDAS